MDGADSQTNTTLLRRLREMPSDRAAWDQFVDRYGRLIYRWCRHWGLQDADAEDVTQNVLLELLRQMRHFVYDASGSFRAWLRTVAYRAWCRFLENKRRLVQIESARPAIHSTEAYENLLQRLIHEDEREILEQAIGIVRLRVQPHTWDAFRMLAFEGHTGNEVAAQLSMNIGAVFVARSKVQKMLREEIQRLGGDGQSAETAGTSS